MDIKDLAGFSEPATALINRIADHLGLKSKPKNIIEMAKAEAEADVIRARGKAQAEVETQRIYIMGEAELLALPEVQQRGLQRLAFEEGKRQQNIESILVKALPEVKDDARPADIEDDWLTNFFDKGRLITDEQMQMLLARILAGEANAPGTYSKRTINLLQSLEREDALVFSKVCNFCIDFGGTKIPLITFFYLPMERAIKDAGITYRQLKELESLGLLRYVDQRFTDETIPYKFEHGIKATYGTLVLNFPDERTFYEALYSYSEVVFTKSGNELAKAFETQPVKAVTETLVRGHEHLGILSRLPDPGA